MALLPGRVLQLLPVIGATAIFVLVAGFLLILLVGPFGGIMLRLILMKWLLGSDDTDDDSRGSAESLLILIGIFAGTFTLFVLLPDVLVLGLLCLSAIVLVAQRVSK